MKYKKNIYIFEFIKLEKFCYIYKVEGRKSKCEEFLDCVSILEYVFGGDWVDWIYIVLESYFRFIDIMLW